MKPSTRAYSLLTLCLKMACMALGVSTLVASESSVELEFGPAWLSRNDARIPNDSGDTVDLRSLTGTGAEPSVRLFATLAINPRHTLRLTIAPFAASGSGTLSRETMFEDQTFASGVNTKATYRFNTYRLTYRWTAVDNECWRLGIGGTLLVRDAEISLQQGNMSATRDDLGFAPLLHLAASYRMTDNFSLEADVDALAGGPGRAIDGALKARYHFNQRWFASLGYRSLEGGADTDDVYAFAWIHAAVMDIGFRF